MSKRIIALALAAALTISSAAALSSCKKDETPSDITEATTADETQSGTEAPVGVTDPLTGLTGYDEKYVGQKLVAVVVENSPSARPQWGMSTPDILMEYEVEGGITRMLWLYSNIDKLPDTIGPVRSARHDIVELALGLDALFIHCGGSTFAYDKLKSYSGTLSEVDGMQSQSFFVRDQSRNTASEHRLTLKSGGLRDWISSSGMNMTVDEAYKKPFSFASSAVTPAGGDCLSAKISFSTSYNYEFKYDAAAAKYNCFINGSERKDDADIQCAYTNVVVLYTDMVAMGTSSGHQDLKLENGGTGFFASNGKYEEIKWSKGGDRDMLKLTKADGSELLLSPGNSYIGFVRSTRSSSTVIG